MAPRPIFPVHSVVNLYPLRLTSRRSLWWAVALAIAIGARAHAQRADSVNVAARMPKLDTATRQAPQPPLSPRRAFLYSLAVPGYAQSRLGRPVAGAIFVFTESIAIALLRESAADLREARLFRRDTLEYIGNDPSNGAPIMHRNAFNDELISIRRGHVEDWIAFLVANHLFAGADAYVAAHLWDLPSQINISQTRAGTVLAARIRW